MHTFIALPPRFEPRYRTEDTRLYLARNRLFEGKIAVRVVSKQFEAFFVAL